MLIIFLLSGTIHAKDYLFNELISQFTNLEFNQQKVFYVKDFFISREETSISLDSGYIYFCNPVLDKKAVAVFVGSGTFSFAPPLPVEQNQLEKFFKKKKMFAQINSAFLIFGDSTLYDIENVSSASIHEPTSEAKDALSLSIKYLINKSKSDIPEDVAKVFLNGSYNDLLYAQLDLKDNDGVILKYNPYDDEEIQLKRCYGSVANNYLSDVIVQFSPHYPTICLNNPKDEIDILTNRLECEIHSSLNITVKSELVAEVLKNNLKWIPLELSDKLEVDSVFDGNNNQLHFAKGKENTTLWIRLNKTSNQGDTLRLKLFFGGKYIFRTLDHTYLASSLGWYPKYGYREKTKFDINFIYPDNYTLMSIGENVSMEKKDDKFYSKWVPKDVCRNASFNVGPFRLKQGKNKDSCNINLYYITSDQIDGIMGDLEQSIVFYNKIYDKLDYSTFNVSEIPYFHGEAFPGMLHLSFATFQSNLKDGHNEAFVSHEVAHQWWGIGLDFVSYRDQWLSEAFSEYSALMYTQQAVGTEEFFDLIDESKKELLNIRKTFLGKGVEEGPICLGYRNNTLSTQGDYSTIIYKKGAWVLHMLRNMLIDLTNMKEDKFFALLKEFFITFKGKRATTCDFKNMIEKKTNFEMDWFFNQWVEGTKIPKYTFAYKIEKRADNQFSIKCRVKQENVPPDFKMFVPVKIVYDDDKFSRMRVFIKGAVAEFELPYVPLQPNKIIFNDLHSVLCETDTESWD